MSTSSSHAPAAPTSPEVDRRGTGGLTAYLRDRRLLFVIVAVGVLLRIAWAIYAAREPVGLQDPSLYRFYAGQIATGKGYTLPTGEPTAYYPVGYPGALGLFYFVAFKTPFDDQVGLYVAFNLVFAAVSLVLAYEIARRVFDQRVALVATAILAVFPNLVFHTAVPLTETLFNALALAAVLVIVATDWARRRVVTLVVFGVLVGLSALVRPPSLLFLPALALAGWWGAGWRWKEVGRSLLVAGVAAVVVIAPWTYRNSVAMGEPVIISTNTGDNLCIGNNPESVGAFRMPASCLGGFDHLKRPEFELARDAHGQSEAIDYITSEPLDQFRLVPLRLWNTLREDTDGLRAAESYGFDPFIPEGFRTALRILANGFYYVTLLLGLAAGPRLLRGRSPGRLFLVIAAVSLLIPPLIFFGDPRFKVPLIPFLAMAAATTIVALLDRRRRPSGTASATSPA